MVYRKIRACYATLILSIVSCGSSAIANDFQLDLPIDCTMGENCFIQQYVDSDPGPGAKDYRCGSASYDGHKGTDFRLLSLRQAASGVPVLAAAPGKVLRARDGMRDRLVQNEDDSALVNDRECGNGVVIQHDDGWETQYCHLLRGSIAVQPGQAVRAGDKIGSVGASGEAQFAHVHFAVRHKGLVIDPFFPKPALGQCDASPEAPVADLWSDTARASLEYRGAIFIEAGFSDRTLDSLTAELGNFRQPLATSPALVFFVRLINLAKSDEIRIELTGPNGFSVQNHVKPMESNKASYMGFTGKRLRGENWPAGQYEGRADLIRDGKTIGTSQKTLQLP